MSDVNLPKDTEELWYEGDPYYHLLTLERDEEGNVYLVAWAYGASNVLAVVPPSKAKPSQGEGNE